MPGSRAARPSGPCGSPQRQRWRPNHAPSPDKAGQAMIERRETARKIRTNLPWSSVPLRTSRQLSLARRHRCRHHGRSGADPNGDARYGEAGPQAHRRRRELSRCQRLPGQQLHRRCCGDRAARHKGTLRAAARGASRRGTPRSCAGYIPATVATARGIAVVTRNAGGFRNTGIGAVDPWTAGPRRCSFSGRE